jgi:hypothetical protein
MTALEGKSLVATCDRCSRRRTLAHGCIGLVIADSPERTAELLALAKWQTGVNEPDLCEKCAPKNS